MTSSHQCNRPPDSPQSILSLSLKAVAVACAATAIFASGLSARSFEDEYAYISQSYYANLFFEGRCQDPAWLEYPAYDLPPLPKYLIGAALLLTQLPMPRPGAAWAWYHHYGHFGTSQTLLVARLPIVIIGALGCVAIFGCGVLLKGVRLGIIAAITLMLNPLYRLHAHRAMSDAPSEAFTLVALALFLWWLNRVWSGQRGMVSILFPCVAGIAAGLAFLSKFSGLLGLTIIAAWTGFALIAPVLTLGRKLTIAGGSIAAAAVALAVFVSLNPFMTARPNEPLSRRAVFINPEELRESRVLADQNIWQRFSFQVKHRLAVSENQKHSFAKDALFTLAEKTEVMVVQGFGRFGLFGPSESNTTVRFDLRQDWGALLWVPLVFAGLLVSIRLGINKYRAGEPPTAFALVIWAVVAWVVVVFYLPMAWDRYLLPIQSGNSLLVAVAAAAAWDRLAHRGAVIETRD
jgi:4-amino-4-deoxy-L-arabinose transferase-like glycosyltransferase